MLGGEPLQEQEHFKFDAAEVPTQPAHTKACDLRPRFGDGLLRARFCDLFCRTCVARGERGKNCSVQFRFPFSGRSLKRPVFILRISKSVPFTSERVSLGNPFPAYSDNARKSRAIDARCLIAAASALSYSARVSGRTRDAASIWRIRSRETPQPNRAATAASETPAARRLRRSSHLEFPFIGAHAPQLK
jgi:hypothetical protein